MPLVTGPGNMQPVQVPDMIGDYGRVLALKQQMQNAPLQNQILQQNAALGQQNLQQGQVDLEKSQRALRDQKVMDASMPQWIQPAQGTTPAAGAPTAQGTTAAQTAPGAMPTAQGTQSPAGGAQSPFSSQPDYDKLADIVQQKGGSYDLVSGLRKHAQDLRDKAIQTAKDSAQTKNDLAATQIKNNGMISDSLIGVMNLPDDQLVQGLQYATQNLTQQGLFDPQHVQMQQQLIDSGDPAAIRKGLTGQIYGMGAYSKYLDEATKKVDLDQKQQAAPYGPTGPAADAKNTFLQSRIDSGQPISAQDQAWMGAYKKTKMLVPTARFELTGQARADAADAAATVARGGNAALANVPPHLIGPATAAATKAGTDYVQAESVSQRLQEMMDAAKQGNVVSYQLLPQEGALQLVTSQGVHRINMAEIQNYGGGSLWQNMVGHLGKALTGQSIPASVLKDMGDMQAIQQRGSRAKYENDLTMINQNYGSNFQPAPIKSTALGANASVKAFKIGDPITQGGHKYKVTAVDASGKPIGAEPIP